MNLGRALPETVGPFFFLLNEEVLAVGVVVQGAGQQIFQHRLLRVRDRIKDFSNSLGEDRLKSCDNAFALGRQLHQRHTTIVWTGLADDEAFGLQRFDRASHLGFVAGDALGQCIQAGDIHFRQRE